MARALTTPEQQPAADDGAAGPPILARAPTVVLALICIIILAVVGWAALRNPLPVLVGVALWGAFVLRPSLAVAARAAIRPSRSARGPAQDAAVPGNRAQTAIAIIGADLRAEGVLSGASRVDVFGRLSGEVQCGVIQVHAGGVLRGRILHARLGIAPDAIFEGLALPSDSAGGNAVETQYLRARFAKNSDGRGGRVNRLNTK